jgi:hypothetical protein
MNKLIGIYVISAYFAGVATVIIMANLNDWWVL